MSNEEHFGSRGVIDRMQEKQKADAGSMATWSYQRRWTPTDSRSPDRSTC